jgi:hypothetical protein
MDHDVSQATRHIFKGEHHLTDEAELACKATGVRKDALFVRDVQSFIEKAGEPIELAQVRAEHYAQKRKRKLGFLEITVLQYS